MESEQLRVFLLKYLKEWQETPPIPEIRRQLKFDDCDQGIAKLIAADFPTDILQHRAGHGIRLAEENTQRLKALVWDLILERILIPGSSDGGTSDGSWPFLSLTEHGKKVVTDAGPTPYDPDGYLERLHQFGLHSTVERYLQEAISSLRTGNQLAAAVMLGSAAERLFQELCEAITEAMADPARRSEFEEKTAPRRKMQDRIKQAVNWLHAKKQQFPAEWHSGEDFELVGKIADLIRYRRNEAGHPVDPPRVPPHTEVYANLQMFSFYCERLYRLRDMLVTKKDSVT